MYPDAAIAVRDALRARRRILLTGPVSPDGDSIGACLALQRLLRATGAEVVVAGVPSFRYAWMPGAAAMVPDDSVGLGWDAVVVMDGDRHRLTPPVERAFAAAPLKALVDHHASSQPDGYDVVWLEPAAASTCEMVYRALPAWETALDPELATLLYSGAVFDTGGFRYSNTSPETHAMAGALIATGIDHAAICARVLIERRRSGLRIAAHVFENAEWAFDGRLVVGCVDLDLARAYGMIDGDLEGVVDTLVHTIGVDVAALLVARAGGTVKYSLRSRGKADVAALAQQLSPTGGGHVRAAGAVIRAPIAEARARLLAAYAALA